MSRHRRHWLISAVVIPLLVACSAVQAPQWASRVSWPVPHLPASLDPAPTFQAGWFTPSFGSAMSCLASSDYAALNVWLKAHLGREVVLEGEVRKAQETITTVNTIRGN